MHQDSVEGVEASQVGDNGAEVNIATEQHHSAGRGVGLCEPVQVVFESLVGSVLRVAVNVHYRNITGIQVINHMSKERDSSVDILEIACLFVKVVAKS